MPRTSLSIIAANTSGGFSANVSAEIRRERRGSGRIVGGVENHLTSVRTAAGAPIVPGHDTCARPVDNRGCRHVDPAVVELLEDSDGDDGVANLMIAAQRQHDLAVVARRRAQVNPGRFTGRRAGPVRAETPSQAVTIGASRSRATASMAIRASSATRPTTTGTRGLMMPAFSAAIAPQGMAEVLLVIERD